MSDLRFDGRVAVVTGAGRGLGRAYALLLASKGAHVVVNDPGASLAGDGLNAAPADEVVAEIIACGGSAIASIESVATAEGGAAIIQTAIDRFGGVDILVHNAGIVRRAMIEDMSFEDFETVLDVHLRGAFHVVHAAFPVMAKANYGRIVLTSSINGVYGNQGAANYSAAKGGIIGLSSVVALEGAAKGVRSNCILPGAFTRMAEGLDTSAYPPMEPAQVAPIVAWLAHESCSITGEMLVAMAGRVARLYVAESPGVYRSDWTMEAVGSALDDIRSTDAPFIADVVPSGHLDHLRYSFAMAKAEHEPSGLDAEA